MRRPRSVSIIGMLLLLQGMFEGVVIGLVLALKTDQLSSTLPPQIADALHHLALADVLLIAAEGLLALAALLSCVAVLLLRPWAWLIAMTVQGSTMAIELFNYLRNRPNYPDMVLAAVIVFYLNTHTVRHVFDVARRRAATPPGRPPTKRTALEDAKTQAALRRQDVADD